jgi:recombination protein RecA
MAKKKVNKDNKTIDIIGAALKKIGVEIRNDIAFLDPEYFVSTGSISLDHILGEDCGLPPGIVEIYGAEGSGKTTLALEILARAQKLGLTTYFFDVEKKLTGSLVRTIRDLDPGKIKLPDIKHGTDVIHALDVILPESPRSVIVVDSVPSMISATQFKEASDKKFYAEIPGLLSDFLPKARTWLRYNQSLLIMLNQIRDNMESYGAKTRTPGGHALKFNADIRLEVKRVGRITKGEDVIGQKIKLETKKNNFARPFQSVELSLIYGYGIDRIYELYELGLQFGVIQKGGSWLTYDDHKVQGSSKFVELLESDEQLRLQLEKQVGEYF